MKAVIQLRYGNAHDVLVVRDIEQPTPNANEVLIRVKAASMHADVWHVVSGVPYFLRLMGNGVRKPKHLIPGSDLAGVVVAVGDAVTRFKVGDEVFGESVKFGWMNGGAYAEYAAVPEEFLAHKPANISFEEAAAVPTPGYIALGNLSIAGPLEGQRILINGAGGAMGVLALQIAKAEGAHVTAVDGSEKRDLLVSLGADRFIDFRSDNYLSLGDRYDFILDVVGLRSPKEFRHALTDTGVYMPIGHADYGRATGKLGGRIVGSLPYFVVLMIRTMTSKKRRGEFKFLRKDDAMAVFRRLIESGKLKTVVARTYPLERVAEAMQCMIDENPIGRLIIMP